MQTIKVRALSALAGAVGALVLFTAPAYAAAGPGNAGSQCLTHSCDAWALTGATPPATTTSSPAAPPPPPPPCQVAPVGNATAGSQSIISFYQSSSAGQGSQSGSQSASPAPDNSDLSAQDQKILTEAQQLAGTSPMPAGEWYQVVATTPADQSQCDQLPLYIWQPGSGDSAILAAGLPVPPGSLAALLYRQLNLPQISKIVLSPQGTSDANLATSVQLELAQAAGSPLFLNKQGNPYVVATAATALGAATVWATVSGLTIDAGTTNAKTFGSGAAQCIEAHPGANDTFMLGSRYTAKQMAAIGPGKGVDCGVTYYAAGTFNLTVTVNWKACWIAGPPPATPGPPAQGCEPVPGAQALQPTTANTQVPVREIQSVNG